MPESNLKLASGFAPIKELVDAGVNVAIGTDGAASNNDLDMLGEMQTAALLAKGISGDATAVPAAEVLKMGTLNGAKAFGLAHEIGSLEPGKHADVIAIDLSHFFTQPIYNPMSVLVYAANRFQVSDVWIAGRRLLHKGEFTHLDQSSIVSKAKYWAEKADAISIQRNDEDIMKRKVTLVEVSPRDGLQNEKIFVPTATKIEFINRLADSGFDHYRKHQFCVPQMGSTNGGS